MSAGGSSETLTMRDRIAVSAMRAIIAKEFYKPDDVAARAYAYADAMLQSRKPKIPVRCGVSGVKVGEKENYDNGDGW